MDKNQEKVTELLEIIDELNNNSQNLTNMLEMLNGYIECYENKYADFWRLQSFLENILKLQYSINEYINQFDDILTK